MHVTNLKESEKCIQQRARNFNKERCSCFSDTMYKFSCTILNIIISIVVCQTKLDMAFVIDSSGSVGIHNFNKVKNFLKDIVDYYNVGFDQTRIALITYSYRVRASIRLVLLVPH